MSIAQLLVLHHNRNVPLEHNRNVRFYYLIMKDEGRSKGVLKMKGVISMSVKELERIDVMDKLLEKRIKQKHAAKQLGISVRQVHRILKRYRKDGPLGLTHKSRGRVSNRLLPEEKREQIINLIKTNYSDFGPTLACEKLLERHGILSSKETVRKLMIAENLWLPKKKRVEEVHLYRERRLCVGELVQLDGSPHKWFEEKASPCTLIAFIDDATSQIMDGMFADYEGTFTLLEGAEHYLKIHGKPLSFYVDKHSTFRINRQATIEEELKDVMPKSQFARAMNDLKIELIFANSPQAKGRVERLFETLQDRLVKEMRLEGISTKTAGTKYFREEYIPKHNQKFAVLPKDPINVHRPILPIDDLSRIFTIQSERKVSRALTVQYKNTRYQLLVNGGYRYTLINTGILIEENKQGNVTFRYKDKIISYKIIQKEILGVKSYPQVVSAKEFQERRVNIPRLDHPWRTRFLPAV